MILHSKQSSVGWAPRTALDGRSRFYKLGPPTRLTTKSTTRSGQEKESRWERRSPLIRRVFRFGAVRRARESADAAFDTAVEAVRESTSPRLGRRGWSVSRNPGASSKATPAPATQPRLIGRAGGWVGRLRPPPAGRDHRSDAGGSKTRPQPQHR